jgi:putative ABC transport system substrate-binding protein
VTTQAQVIAMLLNPDFADASDQLRSAQDAARSIGLKLEILAARDDRDIDDAFARMVDLRAGALIASSDPLMLSRHEKIIALASKHALPAIYNLREFVRAGSPMSYDTSITDAYRQAGIYVGRILRGEKPADLPVMQPTKYELVINMKTAKALGLEVPPTLLARADEVIE